MDDDGLVEVTLPSGERTRVDPMRAEWLEGQQPKAPPRSKSLAEKPQEASLVSESEEVAHG
jgi:hypothetical protein